MFYQFHSSGNILARMSGTIEASVDVEFSAKRAFVVTWRGMKPFSQFAESSAGVRITTSVCA